jgi:hypothetical protein
VFDGGTVKQLVPKVKRLDMLILQRYSSLMDPERAVELAGGSREHLIQVFKAAGFGLTKQAVSLWFREGKIPKDRVTQLRMLRPSWFRNRL